ncbi:MAG: 4Fe-4S binding protein, partial [Proteobacteria bacterium]|nr:4Fe-4S binding protein [Pseudomonadota bacterium]
MRRSRCSPFTSTPWEAASSRSTVLDRVLTADVEAAEDAVSTRVQREALPLYAARIKVYPKRVDGLFRRIKWGLLVFCLAVYYLAPWIRWDRGPHAPNQALLIDLPGRRAYFFAIEIWPQEVYYLVGLLVLAAVGLFLVTSLMGRVWCGYACPTVMREMATLRASSLVYVFFGLFTATTYLLAGWAREQVCTFMCPWPRFQAAMFDENTFTVTYESWRGEPRGKHKQGESWEGHGDCVDCHQCVA